MNEAELAFVQVLARSRGNTVEQQIAEWSERSPAVERGRLVRVRMHARVDKLDLTGLDALREIGTIYQGTLTEVRFGKHPRLEVIDFSRNRLTAIDVSGCTKLKTLKVPGNRITRMVLPQSLVSLDCSHNPLTELVIENARHLREVIACNCQLRAVKVDAPGLKSLQLDGNPIAAAAATKKAPPKPTKTKPTKTKPATAAEKLHAEARAYNWDRGPQKLARIIAHPQCDLGTALYIYWLSEPGEQTEKPWVALLREIERKVKAGAFATKSIPFDVKDVDGEDLSDPSVPAVMRKRV